MIRYLFKKGLTRYREIIDNSIQKDIEKEALSQGFDSVEDWRTHNADNAMHRMGIETQTGMNILLYEKDDYKR